VSQRRGLRRRPAGRRRGHAVLVSVLGLALAAGGCHGHSTPATITTTTVSEAPTTTTTVVDASPTRANMVPDVSYQSDAAQAEARHGALAAYVSGLPDVVRQPLAAGGSEISESVCSPRSEAYCTNYVRTGADLGGPGRAITVANFIFSGQTTGFGNSYSVMYVPSGADQMELSFSFTEDGGSIAGGGFSMQFIYLTPALLTDIRDTGPTDYFQNIPSDLLAGNEFDISGSPEYQTSSGDEIGIQSDAKTVIAALHEFMGSAPQFRTYALARDEQLLDEVKAEIAAGRLSQPVDCESSSSGGAPICKYGPLSGPEETAEASKAETYIGDQEAFINRSYQGMYSLLVSQLAWTTCSACWSGS
jgi:hypothetical protein